MVRGGKGRQRREGREGLERGKGEGEAREGRSGERERKEEGEAEGLPPLPNSVPKSLPLLTRILIGVGGWKRFRRSRAPMPDASDPR